MNVHARGFTLIEVLLSTTILIALVGLSLPLLNSFVGRNDLDITTEKIVSALRRASAAARAADGSSAWGVEIVSGTIVLFKGSTYGSRDTTVDETTLIPGNVTPSGLSDTVFARFTGTPSATGTVTLTADSNNIRTITLNAKSMVDY